MGSLRMRARRSEVCANELRGVKGCLGLVIGAQRTVDCMIGDLSARYMSQGSVAVSPGPFSVPRLHSITATRDVRYIFDQNSDIDQSSCGAGPTYIAHCVHRNNYG